MGEELDTVDLEIDGVSLRVLTTHAEASGAIVNGTRIEKIAGLPNDAHPIGAQGVVVGSIGPVSEEDRADIDDELARQSEYGYFVAWDTEPRLPVFVISAKIAPVK